MTEQQTVTKEVNDQRVNEKGTDAKIDGLIAKIRRMLKRGERGAVSVPKVLGLANREGDGSRLEELRNAIGQRLSQESESLTHEFTLEQRQLLDGIKTRFDSQSNLHPGINWAEVETSLEGKSEALAALSYMESTGGEPDVIKIEGDEFIFGDTSAQSPSGRRDRSYYNADKEVSGLKNGLFLMDEAEYRHLQSLKPVDTNTSSWLKTSEKMLAAGAALRGFRRGERVHVIPLDAKRSYELRGYRCSLRVKQCKDAKHSLHRHL